MGVVRHTAVGIHAPVAQNEKSSLLKCDVPMYRYCNRATGVARGRYGGGRGALRFTQLRRSHHHQHIVAVQTTLPRE